MELLSRARAVLFLLISLAVVPLSAEAQSVPGSAVVKTVTGGNSDKSDSAPAPAEVTAANESLIKLLEDPAGRAALIEALRQQSGAAAVQNAPARQPEAAPDDYQTLAERLSGYTKILIGDAERVFGSIGHSLIGLKLITNGSAVVKWDRVAAALTDVLRIIFSSMIAFWLLQFVIRRFFRKITYSQSSHSALWRFGFLAVTTALDVVVLVVSAIIGFLVAVWKTGVMVSEVSNLETLALNAFVLTHLLVIAVRFVFAERRPALRLLPIKTETARFWSYRFIHMVLWLGYGVMLVVPIANLGISFAVGNTIRFLLVVGVAVYSLWLIHHQTRPVRRGMKEYAGKMSSEIGQRFVKALARSWHIAAYAYVLLVFFIWLSRPLEAFAIVMRATILSGLIIAGGFVVSLYMTRMISGGIRVPEELREKLPALQGRLNAFIPRILKVIRFFVFIACDLLLLDVWGLVSFSSWLVSDTGSGIMSRYFSAGIVLLVSFVIWLAVMSWVDLRLREHAGYVVTARVRTLFQLFRNAFTVVIIVMAALLALSEVGIDIGPLIAGAGVVGLAISFGAQTLVKDIITGAFIQIENAINEGDVVTVGGITGVVERLTVRSVRLRDLDGTTHIVPFSSVDMVSNFMREFSYHVALVGVSYDTDIKTAKAAMEEAFDRLRKGGYDGQILGDLEMHGVTEFADSSVNIRARIKTTPGDQWSTGRAYNEFIKEVFDEWGIEIPFPQRDLHLKAGGPIQVKVSDER